MVNSFENKLKEVFFEIFGQIDSETDFTKVKMGDFADWDSMGHYAFLLAIEDKFGIRFSTQELTDLNSISEILKTIDLRINEQN
jgi:acyl carrier protein